MYLSPSYLRGGIFVGDLQLNTERTEIIQQHRGKIWVESNGKKGVEFYFTLSILFLPALSEAQRHFNYLNLPTQFHDDPKFDSFRSVFALFETPCAKKLFHFLLALSSDCNYCHVFLGGEWFFLKKWGVSFSFDYEKRDNDSNIKSYESALIVTW